MLWLLGQIGEGQGQKPHPKNIAWGVHGIERVMRREMVSC